MGNSDQAKCWAIGLNGVKFSRPISITLYISGKFNLQIKNHENTDHNTVPIIGDNNITSLQSAKVDQESIHPCIPKG